MASTREMRLRIRSVKNIAQVTRALETVSASKVRKGDSGGSGNYAVCRGKHEGPGASGTATGTY